MHIKLKGEDFMISKIKKIDAKGNIGEVATYTLNPKDALVAYLEQNINRNFHTWSYSDSSFYSKIRASKDNNIYSYVSPGSGFITYSVMGR